MTQPQQLRISVSGVDNDLVAPKDAIYPVSQEHGSLPADADHPVLGELHVKGTMVSLVVNIAVAVQLNGNDVALPANREVVLKHGDLVTTLPPTNVELRVRVEEATPLVGAAATATVEEDGEDELAPATSPDAVTPTLVPVTGTEAAEGGNDDNPPKTSTPASADTPNTPPAEAGAQEASMADDDNDDIVDDLNEDGDLDDGPEEGGDASEAAPANAPAAQPDPDTGGSDVTPTPNPPQADAGAQEASMADNDIVDDLDDGPEEGGDASEAAPANAPAAQPDSTPTPVAATPPAARPASIQPTAPPPPAAQPPSSGPVSPPPLDPPVPGAGDADEDELSEARAALQRVRAEATRLENANRDAQQSLRALEGRATARSGEADRQDRRASAATTRAVGQEERAAQATRDARSAQQNLDRANQAVRAAEQRLNDLEADVDRAERGAPPPPPPTVNPKSNTKWWVALVIVVIIALLALGATLLGGLGLGSYFFFAGDGDEEVQVDGHEHAQVEKPTREDTISCRNEPGVEIKCDAGICNGDVAVFDAGIDNAYSMYTISGMGVTSSGDCVDMHGDPLKVSDCKVDASGTYENPPVDCKLAPGGKIINHGIVQIPR